MDIDKLISILLSDGVIPERELRKVCERAKEIFLEESNVQPMTAPVNICGDIHGQFYDLQELLREGGELPEHRYIFIGDFVDRGFNSVETMEYLLCLKVKYPGNILLLRGNHESRQCTQVYGFYEEIQRKYGNTSPWRMFMELFDCIPLAALIESMRENNLETRSRSLCSRRTLSRYKINRSNQNH